MSFEVIEKQSITLCNSVGSILINCPLSRTFRSIFWYKKNKNFYTKYHC